MEIFSTLEWWSALAGNLAVLLILLGIIGWSGKRWRQQIWQVHGAEISRLCDRLNGTLTPLWTGWQVENKAVRVRWRGGLGLHTHVNRRRWGGLLGADAVLALLER